MEGVEGVMDRFLHKCLVKEVGRNRVLGLKLPPRQLTGLRSHNHSRARLQEDRLNHYLRILIKRDDLLQLECVQNFLKAETVVVSYKSGH